MYNPNEIITLGNGQTMTRKEKEEAEARFQRNWTPTTSSCGSSISFADRNARTYRENNGQWPSPTRYK